MDINDVKFSVNRFEKMINENSLLFFDSFEFENIINYYLENGKTEYARKAIELSLSQHPTSSNLVLLKIELYINENKINEADKLLTSILIDENINEEVYILKANILSKKKLHSNAIEYLSKILHTTENKNEIHYLIGLEYLFLEDFINSKSNFIKSLNYNSLDHSTLYNIIYCFEMLNDKYSSMNFLKKYLNKNPYCEISWYNIGKLYYSLKDYKQAIKSFDYSIISDSNFTSPYIEKAKVLQKLKKYQEAITNYKDLLAIKENSYYAMMKIGYCYEKIKENSNALAFYYKAVHTEPSFDKAWYRLAKYFFKNKKFKKANDYIEKAIRINQEKSKYWKLYLKCASLISTKN